MEWNGLRLMGWDGMDGCDGSVWFVGSVWFGTVGLGQIGSDQSGQVWSGPVMLHPDRSGWVELNLVWTGSLGLHGLG